MTEELRQRLPRVECPAFLAFVRRKPCAACRQPAPSQAAHLRITDAAHPEKRWVGLGEKPDDRWCNPLCSGCHLDDPDSQHRTGDERKFWARVGIDPFANATKLWGQFQRRCARSPEKKKAVLSRAKRILKSRKPMMGPGEEAEFVMEKGPTLRKVSRAKDPELFRYRWGAGRPIQNRGFPPKGSRKMQSRRRQ